MLLGLLPVVAAAFATPGAACAAAVTVDGFATDAGSTLAPGATCDELVLTGDATDGAFSWGAARDRRELPAAYEVRVQWQRLTGDGHRPLELHLPGGALMIRDGSYGFYESDARFVADGGWRPLPGHDTRRLHAVRVRGDRDGTIEAWVDDVALGRYRFTTHPVGTVRIGFKGERSYRSRLRYRGPWIVALPAGQ